MAPPSDIERAKLAAKLKETLSSTPYACSSLEQTNGGTTSFVFKGVIEKPLILNDKDDRKEDYVIVKHATGYASCNRDFPIDASRSSFEAHMLSFLQDFSTPETKAPWNVKTPKSYHFNAKSNLQVTQYLASTQPLHTSLPSLAPTDAFSIGLALGSWLRAFHTYTSSPSQFQLRSKIAENTAAEELRNRITWQRGSHILNNTLKHVLSDEERKILDTAHHLAKQHLGPFSAPEPTKIVHGDFWAGKYVSTLLYVPSPTKLTSQTSVLIPDHTSMVPCSTIYVIDFEFTHLSSYSTDLGQFLGDLLERFYLNPSLQPTISELIRGFTTGYGRLDEALAFRTAINAGVQMLNWWGRGPKDGLDESVRKRGVELVREALRWVKAGCERDRAIFLEIIKCKTHKFTV
ncbi:hypothetical protein N0V90_010641 [Kalmusia sp. IMI 367209]|nr:hypothetical protein N0V90_010641 [Kalmusia sp. IMI 367209]